MSSLMHLFNVELVDFVKLDQAGDYIPVEWEKDATHYLQPTKWNNPKDYRPNRHGKLQMPDGFALSVCAVPLKRKRTMRGPAVKVRAPLPPGAPVYVADAPVTGKRAVLRIMVKLQKAEVKLRFITKATSEQCDTLYRNLKVADFYLE